MRHARIDHSTIEENGFTSFLLRVVDSTTGEPLADHEVIRGFEELTLTGIFVKPRPGVTVETFVTPGRSEMMKVPPGGPITAIDDDHVYVDGQPVERSLFHTLYELD